MITSPEVVTAASTPTAADRSLWGRRAGQPIALRIALLALAWLGALAVAALTHQSAHHTMVWLNVTIVPIDLICIWFVVHRARQEGGIRTVIDFKPVDLAWGLLAIVIVFVLFYAASYIGNLVVYHGPPPSTTGSGFHVPLWMGLLCGIVMPLTVALAEELVYRGYAQTRMTWASNFWSAWVSVAVLFALQHVFLTDPEWHQQAARFITTLLAGLGFGALARWWKRLTPLVIGHWAVDFVSLGLPPLLASLR